MGKINLDYIIDYMESLLTAQPACKREMRSYAKTYHIPIVEEVSENFIRLLMRMTKPEKVLELGTAMGYSTINFAKETYVKKVTSIEIREDMASLAMANVKKAGLEEKVEIRVNDAALELDKLTEGFDFIFIDAAKGQYQFYFDKAIRHLNAKGLIVCDNVLFKGMVASDELLVRRKITLVRRLRSFLKNIFEDETLDASLLPLGDGILLIRRKDE